MGFKQTLKVFYFYIRPHRKAYIGGVVFLLIVDILNAISPLILKQFIDQAGLALGTDNSQTPAYWIFILLGFGYFLIAFGQAVCRYFWRTLLIRASYQAAEKIREDYFEKLQKLPPAFYNKRPIGDLMALASNDVEAIRFAIGPGFLLTLDSLFLFSFLPPAMILLSPELTLFALVPMLIVPFLVLWLKAKIHTHFQNVQAHFSKLSAFAQETLEGVRIIKTFVREWIQLKRFSYLGKEFIGHNLNLAFSQALLEQVFTMSIFFGLASLVLLAGPKVISGQVTLGTFVAFTKYLENLAWPMMAIGMAISFYQRGKGSLQRMLEVFQAKEAEKHSIEYQPLFFNEEKDPVLEVRNLTYGYIDSQIVLNNVSFSINKGQKTSLVGSIGSGKSTLIKLISGLYPAPQETIFLNGTDVNSIPLAQRRRYLSLVPQEAFLFSETLGWNVTFGENQSKKEIYDALITAGLEAELKEWDLHTPLGEKGLNLSGGQRARVALARGLAQRQRKLLILDDVLSNIDSQTEELILKHITSLKDTLLMVTHRYSALTTFDQILVLRAGKIIEQGTHADLIRTNSYYNELYELQQMEESLADTL